MDAFKRYADQVKGAGDELAQMAKAQEIFGNEGLRFLPILQLGADGLKEYTEAAIEAGNALPTNKIVQLSQAWEEYQSTLFTVTGIQKKFAADFAKPLSEFLVGLRLIFKTMSDNVTPAFKEWTNILSESMPRILTNIFSIASGFGEWFKLTILGINSITEGLFGMGNEGENTRSVLQTLGDTIATIPETAIITLKRIGAGIIYIYWWVS